MTVEDKLDVLIESTKGNNSEKNNQFIQKTFSLFIVVFTGVIVTVLGAVIINWMDDADTQLRFRTDTENDIENIKAIVNDIRKNQSNIQSKIEDRFTGKDFDSQMKRRDENHAKIVELVIKLSDDTDKKFERFDSRMYKLEDRVQALELKSK